MSKKKERAVIIHMAPLDFIRNGDFDNVCELLQEKYQRLQLHINTTKPEVEIASQNETFLAALVVVLIRLKLPHSVR